MVNIAYDAPVDMAPQEQIEDAERRLYELAETGRYDGGFENFTDASKTAIDLANEAFMQDGHLSGLSCGIQDLDARMGGLQASDLIILAGRPGMGKTSLATNIAYNIASAYEPVQQADGTFEPANGGRVGFLPRDERGAIGEHVFLSKLRYLPLKFDVARSQDQILRSLWKLLK